MKLLIQLLLCITFSGLILYKSVDNNNNLTQLRLLIPILERELREIREKNAELYYAIEAFETPERLLEFASLPQYRHLEFPLDEEVILLVEEPLDGSH